MWKISFTWTRGVLSVVEHLAHIDRLVAILLEVGAHLPVDGGVLLGIHGLADLLVACGALVLVSCLVNRLVNNSAFWGVTTMDT